jgi:DNA-binding HxlR family transcriptional regulator
MGMEHRSGCPINLTLELLGDKWSLLILRDIMFGRKRHFRELMRSQEGISSNILADRLKRLVTHGLLTKAEDPTHLQKALYSLTPQSIELLPVLAQMAVWGRKYLPVSDELAARAQLLDEGGPALWDAFMTELRQSHLLAPAGEAAQPVGTSVTGRLKAAYDSAVLKKQ